MEGDDNESPAAGLDLKTSIDNYLRVNNIEILREYIEQNVRENNFDVIDLVAIARINSDTANLVKELVNSNQVDNTELANQIAKEIIDDIEIYAEQHLKKYQKYTLNALSPSSGPGESAQFFNLISLLKDVSVLGRKLLESAPQFNAQKKSPPSPLGKSATSPKLSSSTSSISASSSADCRPNLIGGNKSPVPAIQSGKTLRDEDATSEDLLAALIESSSTDDFLVLSSSLGSISTRDMIVAALIYIKSHDCFTLSHDIQGVVMVLRRTKFMILNILAPKNQMELITKLLTSIGRYNEMNYVFDLFRDRNQFEVLLSRGVEKTPELRIALFNYVKKNPEFYALVTLNFSMFREIAESLEASAEKRLNKLIATNKRINDKSGGGKQIQEASSSSGGSSLNVVENPTSAANIAGGSKGPTKSLYSREGLNLCLIELIDASDCFAKAGCYKKSNYCESQAKLIALQLSLLPTGKNVLALAQSELTELIVSFQLFEDAYIVAEAYDCHLAWRQALFKNVILNGYTNSNSYLRNYCKKCDLSSALIEELVLLYKKYTSSRQLGQDEAFKLAKAMKSILVRSNDVELKCKIYSQLNFDDAKVELLRDPAIQAHLKDLKLA